MRRTTYFDSYEGAGWPEPKWLEAYFLTAAGRRRFFARGNDSWGLKVEGILQNAQPPQGRIDIDLTIQGHPDLGVLLFYHKIGGSQAAAFYSKGDLTKLDRWIKTVHGDRLPAALFISFETAWKAVKEFIEADGALPESIDWIASTDLPPNLFPGR
jgi:hypothetical protein